jgi:TolB-like protein/cytochrome c-type biogenesis protein CcmH/NrfG
VFEPFPRFRALLQELGRRHVARVAVIYAAVAFAFLEAADIIISALELPAWTIRWVVVFALLGFPVTLILAWVYDLTPQGITRTGPTRDEAVAAAPSPIRLFVVAVLMLASVVLVAGTGWVSFQWSTAPVETEMLDPMSIAVLPLANLDPEDEAGIFASGIHDDLLSQLSKIQDFRVISRTSVVQYRDTEKTAQQIGRELGAGTILEGSVRRDRENGRVRVVTQLIDAATDDHIWAETYDRPDTDIFQVQSEIAQEIARALQAELTDQEVEQIQAASTTSLDAYERYLEGRSHWDLRASRFEALRAVELFEEAVSLDPTFAVAYAALSRARMWLFWNWPGYKDQAVQATEALDRSVELAPEAAETHLAQGFFHFYGRGDYGEALSHFTSALRLKPSDAEAIAAIGYILRRQGRWEEAAQELERALAFDRRSYSLAFELGQTYLRMRRFEDAERLFSRAIAIAPEVIGTYLEMFRLPLLASGDTAVARAVAESLPDLRSGRTPDRFPGMDRTVLESYSRDTTEMRLRMEEVRSRLGPDRSRREAPQDSSATDARRRPGRLQAELAYYRRDYQAALDGSRGFQGGMSPPSERTALLYHLVGDEENAFLYADSLRMEMEAVLEATEGAPGAVQMNLIAKAHAKLGIAHALLGNWVAAVREGMYATALIPVTANAYSGTEHIQDLEGALAQLELVLSVPSLASMSELQLNPLYDTLRDHPRYQALLLQYGQAG